MTEFEELVKKVGPSYDAGGGFAASRWPFERDALSVGEFCRCDWWEDPSTPSDRRIDLVLPVFHAVVKYFKFDARGDAAQIAELLQRPLPYDDMVSCSDEIVETVVIHACRTMVVPVRDPASHKLHRCTSSLGVRYGVRSFSSISDAVLFFSSSSFILEFMATPEEKAARGQSAIS